jgi:hypothetical protein
MYFFGMYFNAIFVSGVKKLKVYPVLTCVVKENYKYAQKKNVEGNLFVSSLLHYYYFVKNATFWFKHTSSSNWFIYVERNYESKT